MFMGRVLAVALRTSPLSGSGVHLRPPSWLIKATNESGASLDRSASLDRDDQSRQPGRWPASERRIAAG